MKLLDTPEKRKQFIDNYLDGIDFIDDSQHEEYINTRYPETDDQLKERVGKFQEFFLEKYKDSNKKVLHLVVTHGTPTRYWSQLNGMHKKKIKYGGLSAIAIKPKGNGEAEIQKLANCKKNHMKL